MTVPRARAPAARGLQVALRSGCDEAAGRARTQGGFRPILPYNLITPASQWQAQIGFRVSF